MTASKNAHFNVFFGTHDIDSLGMHIICKFDLVFLGTDVKTQTSAPVP